MNKKGFTLVELLAVIVILALLIIITAFTTLKLLNRSKIEIEEINVKRYIQDVDNAIMLANTTGEKIENGTYYINSNSLGEKFPFKVESNVNPQGEDDYVVISESKVIKYKITSKSYVITDFGNFEESILENWINVRDYGAIGDGVTDDTNAIKSAVNELNSKGGTLYFPYGIYNISFTKNESSGLYISSTKKIEIEMFGSTINVLPNKYPSYNVFFINKGSDVVIKNGYIVGDRLKHDYTSISGTHEFGYGIFIYYSNAVINNMNISQMTGDAIINKTGTSSGNTNYTLIENSELSYCRRQGLSVLDTDVIDLNNVYIHHIGSFNGINGASPMSGIDIEPGSGTKIVNSLNLNNVKIKNTDYFGIVGNLVNNYNINNCDVDSPSIQNAIINDSTFTYLNKVGYSFNNNKLENSKIYFFAPEQTLFIFDSLINNSIIEGLNETKGNRLGISMSTVITNSTIKNMKGRTGDMALSTQNAGIMYDHNGYGSNIKSQNNVYDNCNMMFNIYYNESNLFNETNSVIKNSYIGVYGREFLNFEKITFENNRSSSYISSTFHPVITFKDCKIIDSGKFGPMKKVLVNSKLIENGIELDSLD